MKILQRRLAIALFALASSAALLPSSRTSLQALATDGSGTPGHESRSYADEPGVPTGVIGVSLHIAAERVGDPAALYVGLVHPKGPAHQAGLSHGDVITTINGTSVTGKSHDQIVKMVRGEVGTTVKLGVTGNKGARDVSLTRVASESLSKGPMEGPSGP